MSDAHPSNSIPLACPQGTCTNGIYEDSQQGWLTFLDPCCLSAASCAAGMLSRGGRYEW